jgi:hypothetical protein
LLVVLAIGLRVTPILIVPSIVWTDEIFQASEQAHRLVYGTGLVPWEFQLGVRSWLLPGIIAALMELARLVGDGPDYYLPLIAVVFGSLGAAPVVCGFLWCRRLFGLAGAAVAGTVIALAPELVHFGARTLSEAVGAHLLLLGLYVLEPGYRVSGRRRLFVGSALLGLAVVVRIQLLPAMAVVALWTTWGATRERLPAIAVGTTVVLLGAAILDTVTLGYPLASLWRYALYNIYYGVSSTFGVEPWHYYLQGEVGVWGAAAGSVLMLAVIGARRIPLLLATAITILAAHSAIAHKEYRFIYPAILCFMVLTGVGLAQLASWGRHWLLERGAPASIATLGCIAAALGFWSLVAFDISRGSLLTALRNLGHDNLLAASFVAHGPAPCGIGLYGMSGEDWGASGGYTHFHRSAPLYWPKDEEGLKAAAIGFDTLVYTQAPPPSLDFATVSCFGRVCVARRLGGCRPIASMTMPVPAPLTDIAAAQIGP